MRQSRGHRRPRIDSEPQTVLYEWIKDRWPGRATYNARDLIPGRAYQIDIAFVAERVAIEVDGFTHHRLRREFATDRRKQNLLVSQDWLFLRFTTDQIYREIQWCLEMVERCLEIRGYSSFRPTSSQT